MGKCNQRLIQEKSANQVVSGLKNMQVQDWIEIDDTYLEKYHLKKSLYQEHRDEVLAVQPGCEDALFESVHYLKEVLCRGYPQMFKLQSPDVIENCVTGDVWDLARNAETWNTCHPLEVMGLLATEDFFILQTDPDTGVSTLKAAGSCFPAGFKIEERVGCSLWEIHAGKVPRYEQNLAKSMDRFFQRLRVDSPIQRFNYAIDDSGELFHRHSHHNLGDTGSISKPQLGDLHLRIERQALQRLPESRDLLFSIRTYVTPIHEVTKDADIARALRTSVNSYGEDVARYKNKALWDDVLQEHIASVLGETKPISKSCEGISS
ncbi:hypothetical protein E4T49_03264 [Aureobasidium sp. EXF-10728]|nr:hypothetical protein E4T49_03264 [Aureobasidium sp. EXF-10728]